MRLTLGRKNTSDDVAAQSAADKVRSLDAEISHVVDNSLRASLRTRRGSGSSKSSEREIQDLLDLVAPDHLTHAVLRRIERTDMKVRRGLSFKTYMVQESEGRRQGLTSTSWLLDQKLSAYRFIDQLGVRRPRGDLKKRSFSELAMTPPCVIKPCRSTGSRGVYLVYAEDQIEHVRDGAHFNSWSDTTDHAASLMDTETQQRPLSDRWFAEELILEDRARKVPARDLKFFCFYGKVLFILEVRRSGGKSEYSFKTPDQLDIVPGDWDYDYFQGDGTTAGQLELASQISGQIPHPFCRIDMLKAEDEMVFGEFTPRPGGYNGFSPEWDRSMGEAWTDAQHRLQEDLLAGKRFDAFLTATRLLDRHR